MKHNISQFIFDTLENKRTNIFVKIFGNFLFFLIFANVVVAIIETLPSLSQYSGYFFIFEIFSIGVFFVEYFLRIATCHHKKEYAQKWGKIKYAFSPMMIFDAIVLFPTLLSFFLPFSFDGRVIRILRILRIIRINRYSQSLDKIIRIIGKHKKDLISAFLLIFIGVFILSTLIFYAEHNAQPEKFKSIPHSIYWGLITISTIGYGDITPITETGKIITAIGSLLGVAIYALPSALLGAAFYAEAQSKEAIHVANLEQEIAILKKKLKIYKINNSNKEKEEKKKKWRFLEWINNE